MPRRDGKHKATKDPRKREPVALAAAVTIVATLAALFGFDLDRETAGGIVTVVMAAAAWWARNRVTPVAIPQLPVDAMPELRVSGLDSGQTRALLELLAQHQATNEKGIS